MNWIIRFMYVDPSEFCGTEGEPAVETRTVSAESADEAWNSFIDSVKEFMDPRFYRKLSVEAERTPKPEFNPYEFIA